MMKYYYIIFGVICVVSFFHFSNTLPKKWEKIPEAFFGRRLFVTSFVIRVVWVFISAIFYLSVCGDLFDFLAYDVLFYHDGGLVGHQFLRNGTLFKNIDVLTNNSDIDDSGYIVYLSFIYALTNDSIIITRLFKALWGAWTCLLIYKIASRNFGENTGRLAGIMCMLAPNLIYYCGLHLKEIEMVFIGTLFVERCDYLLRKKRLKAIETIVAVLVGLLMFFFRNALACVMCLAFLMAVVFSSRRIVSTGKKVIMGVLVALVLSVAIGDDIRTEIRTMIDSRDQQEADMKWRSEREGGNKFAVYAGKTVFAPLIFTIPFPTMIEVNTQDHQQMLNGGNYIKNITSFFTIVAMFMFLKTGNWRKHVLPLSYMLGYLVVLAFSKFAQSERFHMPILPFSFMFAAYALCNLKRKHARYFNFWLIFIFVVVIGWNWFKLAGRGLA
ncbi:MAG: glycosyltransferase family 39 protein [Bacteroidia bacterium]|nr:glycosyltransferase family 39 protein [Bacteroidia bacterium]